MGEDRRGSRQTRATATTGLDSLVGAVADAVAERLTDALAEIVGSPEPDRLLTSQDLCERLQVSAPTLRSLRRQGLPTLMVGESPRHHWPAVLEYLRTRGAQ